MFAHKFRNFGRFVRSMSKKMKIDASSEVCANSSGAGSEKNTVLESFENGDYVQLPTPAKSDSDKKQYSVIRLRNGLTAVLVSDPQKLEENEIMSEESSEGDESEDEAGSSAGSHGSADDVEDEPDEKLAACALSVGVGSFSDPPNIKGLAHFLEHMVFMGSSKYPKENAFDAFIKRHGGSDNASTDCENTTFYFECQEPHLHKAMDIFSQFFISPLMKREAMAREREAIESEFQMSLPKDGHRKQQLICSTAKPENPVGKFMWGNMKTLKEDVSDDKLYESVHEFRRRHYSAHRMTLAVQARLPLDILRDWVIECFSQVPSNRLPPDQFPKLEQPYDITKFHKIYYIEPMKDICELELNFVLPPVETLYKSKPDDYLAWLIGHEGKGSLIAYLRKKLWALGGTVGLGDDGCSMNSLHSLFSITITLTETGYHNVNEVIKSIFSYINMLKQLGPNERIFKEIQSVAETNFRFEQEDSAASNVEKLVEAMQYYPSEDYLTGDQLLFEYKPDEIVWLLNYLSPDTVNVAISSKAVSNQIDLDQVEPWFGTKYACQDIPADWLQSWKEIAPFQDYHLPEPNIFIPNDFSILEATPEKKLIKYPQKIRSSPGIDIWYKQDTKFNLPYAQVYFHMISTLPLMSATNAVLLDLYMSSLKQLLVEEIYPANLAQLQFSMSLSERGCDVNIDFNGFNQNIEHLVKRVVSKMATFGSAIEEPLFLAMKKVQKRNYVNNNLKVGFLARDVRMSLLLHTYWTALDKQRVLQQVTLDMLKEFVQQFNSKAFIQVLAQGNISQEKTIELADEFVNTLEVQVLRKEDIPRILVADLPPGERCIRVESFNLDDSNCVTTEYVQGGPCTIPLNCLIDLLMMLMEEPLFDTLRTQEQLGYDVSCSIRDTFGILGFTATVISQITKWSVDHVHTRLITFLNSLVSYLNSMPEVEFQETVLSLIKTKQLEDTFLREEVSRNWSEITNLDYMFDRHEREIEHLKTLSKADVIRFLESQLSKDGKRLTVQVVGHSGGDGTKVVAGDSAANQELKVITEAEGKPADFFIPDIPEFKTTLSYYPPPPINHPS